MYVPPAVQNVDVAAECFQKRRGEARRVLTSDCAQAVIWGKPCEVSKILHEMGRGTTTRQTVLVFVAALSLTSLLPVQCHACFGVRILPGGKGCAKRQLGELALAVSQSDSRPVFIFLSALSFRSRIEYVGNRCCWSARRNVLLGSIRTIYRHATQGGVAGKLSHMLLCVVGPSVYHAETMWSVQVLWVTNRRRG